MSLARRTSAYSYRVSLVREPGPALKRYRILTPDDAVPAIRHFLPTDLDREVFGVLMLSTRNVVTGYNLVSVGTLNGTIVHAREVFKPAILASAAALILFHNHPSGDPAPSLEDRSLTARLKKAGAILGIEVLDHVIVTDAGRSYSFREGGW